MNNSSLDKFEFLSEVPESMKKAIQKFASLNLLSFEFSCELFCEFYKFFELLCAKLKENSSKIPLENTSNKMLLFAPAEILRIWEFHIQNTAKYPLFCEQFLQKYLHYSPELYRVSEENEQAVEEIYNETLVRMKKRFPKEFNGKIWASFEEIKKNHLNSFNINLKTAKNLILEEKNKSFSEEKIRRILLEKKCEKNPCKILEFFSTNEKIQKLFEKLEKFIFPASFLQILQRNLLLTREETNELFFEYKKFLLMSLSSDFPIAPSGFIDECWHLHMLYTRNYLDFCKELNGKILLHVPIIEENKVEKVNLKDFYVKTLQLYKEFFAKNKEETKIRKESGEILKEIEFLEEKTEEMGKIEEKLWPNNFLNFDLKLEHKFKWVNFS